MKLDDDFLDRIGAPAPLVPPFPERPKESPGPLATLAAVRRNMLATFRDCDFESRIVRHRMLRRQMWIFNTPAHVREALQLNARAFERKSPQQRHALGPLAGDGLIISDGPVWALRRRIVAPIVHGSQIADFAPLMRDTAEDWRAAWAALPEGAEVNMLAEMGELAAQIISRTVFGRSLTREDTGRVVAGFTDFQRRVDHVNIPALLGLPDWLPRLDTLAARPALAHIHGVVDDILERFMRAADRGEADAGAVIAKLWAARDEDGRPLTREAIRNEAIVIFLAGHETTASTMAWCWYLLSQCHRTAGRLRAELDGVLGGRAATLDDVPALTVTRAIVEEVLRLYPPIPLLGREAVEPGEVGGRRIQPGDILVIAPWLLHRNRDVWSWPDAFLPERFETALAPRPAKHAYIPFATGPRICPGLTFGLTEAVICLATLAQDFDPAPAPGHAVEVDCHLTLRPGPRLPMAMRRRARAEV